MPKQPIITAIDLGTDKCVTLIAGIEEDNTIQVLGVAVTPSQGIRKSQIVDLEKVTSTITESLDAAERMAGLDVKSAYFSVSGNHIASQNSKGVVAVGSPTQEITHDDVARVIEAARAVSLPSDREIIHIIPHDFSVDSQTGIKDPVGMTGIRLEAEVHLITGMSTTLRNLQKCAQDLGLYVDGFVFSGLASAEMIVTETEKELGVVLVDIGAGSTSVCAYVEGALVYSDVFPVGARHITQDIALGCRVSIESAEKIKLSLNDMKSPVLKMKSGETKESFRKRKKDADMIDVQSLGIDEPIESLSKKTLLEGIMLPRMKEIFMLIGKELQQQNLLSDVPAGLIITGGGAETVGIIEVAKRTLNLPARTGKPVQLRGLIEDIQKPAFATVIGLLLYGKAQGGGHGTTSNISLDKFFKKISALPLASLGKKIVSLIKSLLP
jgi:cell division protein FtsA